MENIHTRSISVQRQFAAFDDFWNATRTATSIHRAIEQLDSDEVAAVKANLSRRFGVKRGKPVVCEARANAVSGHVVRR